MKDLIKFTKFFPTAKTVADLSKDPSTKVGAIALDEDYNILVVGYNGFPRKVVDSADLYANRDIKYQRIVHAEMNIVAQAASMGVSLKGCTVLITSLHPCSICTRLLIQAGVKQIIVGELKKISPLWQMHWEASKPLLKEAQIPVYEWDGKELTLILGEENGN